MDVEAVAGAMAITALVGLGLEMGVGGARMGGCGVGGGQGRGRVVAAWGAHGQ